MSEIKQVKDWIDAAKQEPTPRNVMNYAGFIFSECSELLHTIGFRISGQELEGLSKAVRKGEFDSRFEKIDLKKMMDDAADVAWTSIGLMHMLGDAQGAFAEVVRSNYSKFEGGVCELDATGKVVKGPSFSEPDLEKFIRKQG